MRLAELKPKWVVPNGWVGSERFACGVTFRCPHCPETGQRIGVAFWPPIDPDGLVEKYSFKNWHPLSWVRASGDTFDTLTLSPSLDISVAGHWHGHIVNGEVQ